MYNQAKNVVLNVSEMEAKVREATNDEPWGASSTLMQEIAQGTFSFQYFNEIMPCIYARFMEKEARQWRQIYKALQLLEYLVKNGSERVVDDARSHISTIKMLRNFHYIDDKGKDEGTNVRNRSRELVELLMDVEKIRTERRKAKTNKSKYTGIGNDGFGGGYGGFGNDDMGGSSSNYSSNDFYASGGGSGSRSGGFRDSGPRREEYDAGDDEVRSPRTSTSTTTRSNSVRAAPTRPSATPTSTAHPPAPAPAPAPVVDLLGGLDDDFGPPVSGAPVGKPAPNAGLDDDDFADFQAAPVASSPPAAAPKSNLMDILNASTPASRHQSTPSLGGVARPLSGFGSAPTPIKPTQSAPLFAAAPLKPTSTTNAGFGGAPLSPTRTTGTPTLGGSTLGFGGQVPRPASSTTPAAAPAAKSGSGFDDLWNLGLSSGSSAGTTAAGKKPVQPGAGRSIMDLQREKAQAGLWGSGAATGVGGAGKPAAGAGGNSSGFGSFGNASSASGGDDLLL